MQKEYPKQSFYMDGRSRANELNHCAQQLHLTRHDGISVSDIEPQREIYDQFIVLARLQRGS